MYYVIVENHWHLNNRAYVEKILLGEGPRIQAVFDKHAITFSRFGRSGDSAVFAGVEEASLTPRRVRALERELNDLGYSLNRSGERKVQPCSHQTRLLLH